MDFISFLPAAVLGYTSLHYTTHPGSYIRNRLPDVKISKLQIFPCLKIFVRGHVLHFHHWFNFSVLLIISVFISNGVLDSTFTRGFLVGGALQGLSISPIYDPNVRRLIYNQIKKSLPKKRKGS